MASPPKAPKFHWWLCPSRQNDSVVVCPFPLHLIKDDSVFPSQQKGRVGLEKVLFLEPRSFTPAENDSENPEKEPNARARLRYNVMPIFGCSKSPLIFMSF